MISRHVIFNHVGGEWSHLVICLLALFVLLFVMQLVKKLTLHSTRNSHNMTWIFYFRWSDHMFSTNYGYQASLWIYPVLYWCWLRYLKPRLVSSNFHFPLPQQFNLLCLVAIFILVSSDRLLARPLLSSIILHPKLLSIMKRRTFLLYAYCHTLL